MKLDKIAHFSFFIFSFFLTIFLSLSLSAQESKISGYYKGYLDQQKQNDKLEESDLNQLLQDFRINGLHIFKNSTLQFEWAYEVTSLIQNQNHDFNSLNTSHSYRIADISTYLGNSTELNKNKIMTMQNLDRLSLRKKLEKSDLTAGRQAISFGAGRIANPTDVFFPYSYQTLNQEYRQGIDAIRWQIQVNEMSELDLGYVLGKDAKNELNASFARFRFPISTLDSEFLLIHFQKALLWGGSFQFNIGNAGAWIELANVKPSTESIYNRANIGISTMLENETILWTEFHYNEAGLTHATDYSTLTNHFAYTSGGDHLLGQHYWGTGLGKNITPLITFDGQFIANLDDSSVILMPKIEYNWKENYYSDLIVLIPTGRQTSEFSPKAQLVAMSLRYYW